MCLFLYLHNFSSLYLCISLSVYFFHSPYLSITPPIYLCTKPLINHVTVNLLSTMTRFHIYSGYYLVILYNFRNLCEGLK
ncbi:hypothetical protein E2C01_021168 [Portunus trituberculatus]|uniref:Uncharacterized protein n=1 Tax=Portunus trituberculatus TaxID=210409 RepID=A0A5B7E3N1_PORTR|nr:hypothetical protein [Portunus trituberculatus]